jgi:hypothetical protein
MVQYCIAPTSEPHRAVDRLHGSYTAVLTLVALFVWEAMKWTSSLEGWSALPGHVLAVHLQVQITTTHEFTSYALRSTT